MMANEQPTADLHGDDDVIDISQTEIDVALLRKTVDAVEAAEAKAAEARGTKAATLAHFERNGGDKKALKHVLADRKKPLAAETKHMANRYAECLNEAPLYHLPKLN